MDRKKPQESTIDKVSKGVDTAKKAYDFIRNMGGAAEPPSYKKGGTVKKTGMALVHKGEKVLTKKQAAKPAVKKAKKK
jgi:hypothetical protein